MQVFWPVMPQHTTSHKDILPTKLAEPYFGLQVGINTRLSTVGSLLAPLTVDQQKPYRRIYGGSVNLPRCHRSVVDQKVQFVTKKTVVCNLELVTPFIIGMVLVTVPNYHQEYYGVSHESGLLSLFISFFLSFLMSESCFVFQVVRS